MELTRTKHWGRIWSCVQSLMSPGILLGSGLTSYAGKPGFYACATAVLIGAGLLGFQLIDVTKCSSPPLSSSEDNDSPIPPAPPPISLGKYGHTATPLLGMPGMGLGLGIEPAGFYPLRKSISLQQPVYPCCREAGDFTGLGMGMGGIYGMGLGAGYPPGYSPYCRECVLSGSPLPWGMFYPPTATPNGTMIRSYSLPQAGVQPSLGQLKSTGTQTNPNSPVRGTKDTNGQISLYPGSYDRLPTLPGTFLPQDRVIRDTPSSKTLKNIATTSTAISPSRTTAGPTFRDISTSFKNTVMFASNPQLFPASSSATSTTDRSATPTYGNNNHNHSHANHHIHHHDHHNNHHSHQHPSSSNGHFRRDPSEDQDQDSDKSSPRHYYPQKEERRANFIKSHHQQSQKQKGFEPQQAQPKPSDPQQQRYYPSTIVTVETHTHKTEGGIIPVSGTSGGPTVQSKSLGVERQQPAFTRHYFDSSKIQKGSSSGAGQARNIFNINSNVNTAISSKSVTTTHTNISTNPNANPIIPSGSNRSGFYPQSQQPHYQTGNGNISAQTTTSTQIQSQTQQSLRNTQTQPTLPISLTAINAKLQQFKRQQQQQRQISQTSGDLDWRSIQRQSASGGSGGDNPFENDPDPPYYPAALSHAQTHAYGIGHGGQSGRGAKVSGNEFDVEQPKFNSLRRSLSRSGQNSSVSSQLNYSITPTPVHQRHPVSGNQGQTQQFITHQSHHQHSHHQLQHGSVNYPPNYPFQHPQGYQPQTSQSQSQNQDLIMMGRRRQGINENINVASGNGGRDSRGSNPRDDCPYCDPSRRGSAPPPLSLSVPTLQQSNPHYMCHYGYTGGTVTNPVQPILRRRNTWHHHRGDQLEAITTSV